MRAIAQPARARLWQGDCAHCTNRGKTRLASCGCNYPSRPTATSLKKRTLKVHCVREKTRKSFFRRTKLMVAALKIVRICEADLGVATRDTQTSTACFACYTANCTKRNLRTCRSLVKLHLLRCLKGTATRPPQTGASTSTLQYMRLYQAMRDKLREHPPPMQASLAKSPTHPAG